MSHIHKAPEEYASCPGLTGTHLDYTLGIEQRVSKLIAAANLTEMIGQLTNAAPPIERLVLVGTAISPIRANGAP